MPIEAETVLTLLPTDARLLLDRAARLAASHGWPAYLVGGPVRDAVMGRQPTDLDISVVGNAPLVAAEFARELGVPIQSYDRFGSATVVPSGSPYHVDFVTARRENYPAPGALPAVDAGTILDDLARRDFTINALAVPLAADGVLIDPHGGYADVKRGKIVVLHDASFRDDPTRLYRAVRFSERLGFTIAQPTLELMLLAVRDRITGSVSVERISRELMLSLEEPRAGRMLAALDRLGLLEALSPELGWPYSSEERVISEGAPLTSDARRDAYLAAIARKYAGSPDEAGKLARKLRLTAPHTRLVRESAELVMLWPELRDPHLSQSRLYTLLNRYHPNTLSAFTLIDKLKADGVAFAKLQFYLDTLRYVRPLLTGDDLLSIGIAPGPIYKQLLDALMLAKLDGKLPTREDELDFITRSLKAMQTPPAQGGLNGPT